MKSIIWVTQAGGLIMRMPQVSMAIIKPLIHPDLFNNLPKSVYQHLNFENENKCQSIIFTKLIDNEL